MTKKIDIQSLQSNVTVNKENFMLLLKIYHHMRFKLKHEPNYKKSDLVFIYGKHKKLVEDIWECYNELKIEYPYDIYKRVFES